VLCWPMLHLPALCFGFNNHWNKNKKSFYQDKMIKEGHRHHQEGQGSIPVKKERRRITKYVVKGRSWESDLQELLQEGNMKGQTRDGFLSIKSGVH
jgi:hypothetical protein